jgi:hypothetical protein
MTSNQSHKSTCVAPYTLAFALALAATQPAFAQSAAPTPSTPKVATVAAGGVAFEEEIVVGGRPLALNGTGIRTKFFLKIYAAGLYLPVKVTTPQDVFKSPGPKRLKVSVLRELDAAGFGKTAMQVMSDNLPKDRMSRCVPGLIKLGEVFANKKKMAVGEFYTIDEIPGIGVVISINGKPVAEIAEPEFFTCLMYNYFGEKPADDSLKTGLLGGAGS